MTKADNTAETRVGMRKTRNPAKSPLMTSDAVNSAIEKASGIPRMFTPKREIIVMLVEGKAMRRTIL
jgi:hypothetical protein